MTRFFAVSVLLPQFVAVPSDPRMCPRLTCLPAVKLKERERSANSDIMRNGVSMPLAAACVGEEAE